MTMHNDTQHLQRIDFFHVEPQHNQIHSQLENWARYVAVKPPGWAQHPMWRQGKSNGRQWHLPQIREEVDTLDGHRVEKAVAALPDPYKSVLRWAYVYRFGVLKARRVFGMTEIELYGALSRARSMLKNTLDGPGYR